MENICLRREDNNEMHLREGWKGVGGIHLAHATDRWRSLVHKVKNLRVPYNMGNLLTCSEVSSLSSKAFGRGVC